MISKKALKAFGRKKTLAVAIPLMMAAHAQGFEFYMGDMEGSLDSQISVGASWRMEDQDPDLIMGMVGSETNRHNNNDGNLSYENGDAFSQIFKGSHDLQVSYGNYGAFVRGKYWYDAVLEDGERANEGIMDEEGVPGRAFADDSNFNSLAQYSGAEILDAFVYGEFDLFDMPLDIRLGKQVVSWGESTFILGGVNQINPIDVSSFRRPGAEIKEGLIPVNMAFASIGLTENLSAEAFYQLGFQETVISSRDNYFSTNDYACEGCGPVETAAGNVSRSDGGGGIKPSDDGQFGIAFRYFSEELDTEFGFYAMNIHSRMPLLSGIKADIDEIGIIVANPIVDPTSTAGSGPGGTVTFDDSVAGLMAAGLDQATATVSVLASLTTQAVDLGGTNPAYSVGYPEDLQLAGISFATNVKGIALSGELTHKLDVPFQVNASQLLGAILQADATKAWVLEGAGATSEAVGNAMLAASPALQEGIEAAVGNSFAYEVALLTDGEMQTGYKTFDVTQLQVTAVKLIDQVLGASRFAIVAEAGYTYAHEFDENTALRFDGNGNLDDTVTQSSWGYRARIIGQYSNVFAGVNLSPVLSISHDVEGVAPAPGGNFIEDQKVIGLTLNAEYLNTYTAAVSYTQYSGGKTFNIADRDFASFTLGMQF